MVGWKEIPVLKALLILIKKLIFLCCQQPRSVCLFNGYMAIVFCILSFTGADTTCDSYVFRSVECGRIPDSIGKDIEKICQSIYPLHDVFVRKVKILKKPKFDRTDMTMLSMIVCSICFSKQLLNLTVYLRNVNR